MTSDTNTSIKHRKVYMHTIDREPGFYTGEQICFLPRSRAKGVLRDSLQEIREEQRKTIEWRKAQGMSDRDTRYGYRMFYV